MCWCGWNACAPIHPHIPYIHSHRHTHSHQERTWITIQLSSAWYIVSPQTMNIQEIWLSWCISCALPYLAVQKAHGAHSMQSEAEARRKQNRRGIIFCYFTHCVSRRAEQLSPVPWRGKMVLYVLCAVFLSFYSYCFWLLWRSFVYNVKRQMISRVRGMN